jgi:hypothetical protein
MEKKNAVVAHTCYPSDSRKHIGELLSRPAWAKSENLFPKQPEQKGMEMCLKW